MDRNRNKIIDIVVSRNREKWLFVRMAMKLENKGYKVNSLCTDGYEGYGCHRLAKRHVITKSETALVESKNSLISHHLARFNRKTRKFSKAFDMIFYSLLMLFNKDTLLTMLI